MKIATVVGARPQFIKAAVVSRALRTCKDVEEVIIHTGQHYDENMSGVFFEELEIPRPDVNLGIGGGTHGQNTGRMIEAIEKVLQEIKPDKLLVYGDTDSTAAGALAAVKLHIPVAHVEAGLRSFNRRMPEEINRIVTDHISHLLFAPTENARTQLLKEGIPAEAIHQVGDVMYDASLFYRTKARPPSWAQSLGLENKPFVLATVHRAENTDSAVRLQSIFAGLGSAGMPVVLPLHPRTRCRVSSFGIRCPEMLHLLDPVGYLEMQWLQQKCVVVATDSGGLQKESYFHAKPCVILREETEWGELVEAGWNSLAGANAQTITACLMSSSRKCKAAVLYGEGHAAEGISDVLLK
jgi:UDP-GlcNAc3NAcA epimerase